MGNIEDYLDWRGDITLDMDAFNEVDNLLLSELVYTDFGGIVPEASWEEGTDIFSKSITLTDAYERFFAAHNEEELMAQVSSVKVAPLLMHRMVKARRFEGLRLCGYVNEISKEDQVQFSVLTFLLPDDSIYVAYRGTDNSLIGWKEDFNMSFLYETPGQKSAAMYLTRHFLGEKRTLRIGGHSKGGNFAVFASAFCEPSIQEQILEVYSNDGPGFRPEVLEAPGYLAILPRVISTLPEQSVVGVLLGSDRLRHRYVKSANTGLMQHDAMSWQVEGNHFVYAMQQGRDSEVMDEAWKGWLKDLDAHQRKRFVDLLFDSLMASGANTTDELVKNGARVISEGVKAISEATPEDQRLFFEVFFRLAGSIGVSKRHQMAREMEKRLPLSDLMDKIG